MSHNNLGNIQRDQGDLGQAKVYIQTIIIEAPDNNQAQDLNDQVLKLVNQVSQLIKLGSEAQANDKYLEAREYYMDILERKNTELRFLKRKLWGLEHQ